MGAQHAAPFVEASASPEDRLRQILLDDESDEAAAIAAAASEFMDDERGVPLAGIDADQYAQSERSEAEPESTYNEEPEADLRRSLYDEQEPVEEPSTDYDSKDEAIEYVPPPSPAGDSSIWMAGAATEERAGTGPLSTDYGRTDVGTEGVSDLRAKASGPPGQFRRTAGQVARAVIIVSLVAAAAGGLYQLSQGPVGAFISEALTTDVRTETPISEPTATLRPAPTLPPVTEVSATVPTAAGTPSSEPKCVLWDSITLEDEGAEVCVYGVLKRWFAGSDIPFMAIFSEELGTFAIIDRTTTHPVGPGDCILARGTVEIMRGTRPDIDAQGLLEACPEGLVEG